MDQKQMPLSMMLALALFMGAWGLVTFSMTKAKAAPPDGLSCSDAYYRCTFSCTLDAVDIDGCISRCGKWWKYGCKGPMPTGVLQLRPILKRGVREVAPQPPASILGDGPSFPSQGPAPVEGGRRGGSGTLK